MAQLKSTNITGNLSVTGNVLASKIIKFGGTADDILMGDGSITSKQGLIDSLEAAMEGNSWRPIKYGTTTVSDTSTTLEFIAGSNIGLTFTDGKLTIANNYSYSLPLAANGTRGGIQVGYTASGANLPVQLSNEKAYVALTKTAVENVVTIPTVYDGTLTLKASDGATATQQTFTANDADSVTFEVKHAVPTGASATNYGPSDGGTQTAKGTLDIVVPQITTDKFGHITSVSNKTFKVTDTDTNTWQANTKDQDGYVTKGSGQANKVWKTNADGVPGWRTDSNTDTKVTQSNTTTANWRKVILSNQSDAAMGTATTAKTDVVYVTPNVEVQPSTGSLRTTGNILLHNPDTAGGDSPKLVFQRGDEKGTVTDWNMYVQSGALKINSIPTSNSTAETKIAEFAYHGGMTVYSPSDSSGVETSSMIVKTSNGGQLILGKEGPNSGTMLRFDQTAGTTRLRFRASSTAGAMVWEQPEAAARLYLDFGNAAGNGTNRVNVPNPEGGGTLALLSDLNGFITSVPNITITDTGTKPIVGDITASGHTITVSRIGLDDLGLASAYKYQGSVAKYENLPTSNQKVGDVWNVTDTGMNYAWNDTAWDALGWIVDLSNYATKTDLASYLPLAGNTNTTLMTGSIKYGGKTQEIISIAPEYQSGSWKGGMKYSWDSKTTIALWGKNADCQFVWHAGADFSTGSTDGWTNRNYDFQVGRNSSSTLEALLGGKPLATQEWVTNQLGSGGDFNLSNYVTLNTPQTIDGVKTFSAQPVISTASGLKFANGNCTLKIYNTGASPTDYAAIEVRSNSASTNRNLFIDLANNSLVVGAASGTPDTTYKVNVKDTFNATTIYENGTALSSKYLGINDKAADSSKLDGKTPETTLTTNSDAVIPTSKAIATYVTNLLEDLELGDNYQPKDTDLTAIAGLGDDTVTGLLRKKGKNSWEIDSNTYLKPGSNASANYLAFFKDGDEVSGSQNTHCDGVGNIKAASYGIYTDVANNKTATWQYNSSTDCVELVW